MRKLLRFFNTWSAVRRVHRYADQQHEWTEEDRQALAAFLRSPAGAKMERLIVDRILDGCQAAVSEQCKPFEAGTVHGMKVLYVFLKTLTSAGGTPETDPNYED